VELRKKSRDAAVARRDALDALERSTARDARVRAGADKERRRIEVYALNELMCASELAALRTWMDGAGGTTAEGGGDAAKSDDGDGDGDGSGSEDEGEGDEDASAVGPLPTHLRV
jgi:hypothetical protein